MISNRSKTLSTAGLALAAVLALGSSSCQLFRGSESEHALDVKADTRATTAPTQRARSTEALGEPEYFEGDVAPAVPAALPESRPKAPSSAHVWIAGQHTRQDGKWVWVPGHYAVPPSADQVWVPGHWVSHLHGYAWIPGAWR